MANVPSGNFLEQIYKMCPWNDLELAIKMGRVYLAVGYCHVTHSGRVVTHVKDKSVEGLVAVRGENFDGIIDSIDLTHFCDGQADAVQLWTLLTKYKQVFGPTTAVAKGRDFTSSSNPKSTCRN
jgi:hypothetical protein